MQHVAAQLAAGSASGARGEWDASDDEAGAAAEAGQVRLLCGGVPQKGHVLLPATALHG